MKNLKKSLVLVSSLALGIGLTAGALNADASANQAHRYLYHVVFSGGELGAKPDTCIKLVPPKGPAKVNCTGNVPETLKTKILKSNALKLEVPSDGSGGFTFIATRISTQASNTPVSTNVAHIYTYHVAFSGGESGAKPNTCTKIVPLNGPAKVRCSGDVPEDVITQIRESNAPKLEVSSGGSGGFSYEVTRLKQLK